ncbi:MAG: hypothetical protein RIR09_860 [Pseudomonadota bacterium]
MTTLAAQQQALLEALFAWPVSNATKNIAAFAMDSRARGLKVYQSNGHALAERALQGAYPVLAQLLGHDSFVELARALWHAHPPVHGDVALWGAQLPQFVAASADLQGEPYLEDVASLEWALHCVATATDGAPDLSTLSLLTTEDPAQLVLCLAPGSAVLTSAWPVVSIVQAHREPGMAMAEVGALVRQRVGQSAVVWRAGFKPSVRQALAGEAALLKGLLGSCSLGDALDGAGELDFAAWLPLAVQTGLVLGARARDAH